MGYWGSRDLAGYDEKLSPGLCFQVDWINISLFVIAEKQAF